MTTLTPDEERQLQRLEAIHAVQNLQARYDYLHFAHIHEDRLALFALDTPGVRIAMDWGVYEERAGVERFFLQYQAKTHQPIPGAMALHTLTSPLIEVADDLTTASAMWISPGAGAGPAANGRPANAGWLWVRYDTDFVQENGEWKIWHLGVSMLFASPFEKSWVDAELIPQRRQLPPGCEPDRVPDLEWTGYRVDRPFADRPALPRPHLTFEDSRSR
ncbi:nuclear transport factor 2 family protein [Streptomyces sp. NPDC090493]|uniref:nuclear transport factor 2 family protein n=1 Tax=Streptomyces sp. NPDC090493 TaxID=3365964 RepID=UPI003822B064